MITTSPQEIVRCLLRDFYGNVTACINYAERIASTGGPLAPFYLAAVELLRREHLTA